MRLKLNTNPEFLINIYIKFNNFLYAMSKSDETLSLRNVCELHYVASAAYGHMLIGEKHTNKMEIWKILKSYLKCELFMLVAVT